MAQIILTGGDGITGQSGLQTRQDINTMMAELYAKLHTRSHAMGSNTDHSTASVGDRGKLLGASATDGKPTLRFLVDADIPATICREADFQEHLADYDNPHHVTAEQLGLNLTSGLVIPQLKIWSGRYKPSLETPTFYDTLHCYWSSHNINFLAYNPQIWLFRPKNHVKVIETLGDNRVLNGDFLNGSDGWGFTSNVIISGGQCKFDAAGTEDYLNQKDVLEAGEWYKVTYSVSGSVTGSYQVACGTVLGSIKATIGDKVDYIKSDGTDLSFIPAEVGSTFSITGIHAYKVSDYKRLRKKKWNHEPHLLGTTPVNPAYYTGQIIHPVPQIQISGRHTAWDLTALTNEARQEVPIDIWEWVAGYSEEDGWVKLAEDFDYITYPITSFKIPGRQHASLSQPFRICLVIDNPLFNPLVPTVDPKIMGPLSDIFYLRFLSSSYDGGTIIYGSRFDHNIFYKESRPS